MAQNYGWIKDAPDERDWKLTLPVVETLPKKVDLRGYFPQTPYQQGRLGSCTGNAIGGVLAYTQSQQHQTLFVPSRLFIYYNEREREGTVATDSGASIRDGFKSIAEQGVCREDLWPYDINVFTTKPSGAAYENALKHRAIEYRSVNQDLQTLKHTLASGFPMAFGISVYDSFENSAVAHTGDVPMPQESEECLGGHAIVCCGYDDDKQVFFFRNSWGQWGERGYGTLPYSYVENPSLASNFWVVTLVSRTG